MPWSRIITSFPNRKVAGRPFRSHPICHRAIHTNFTNAELARIGTNRDALLKNQALSNFVAWVKGKPPNFHAPTFTQRR